MKETVTIYSMRHETLVTEDKDSYSFRKDRGFHRVQKLCLWVLEKIGARNLSIDKQVKFVRFSPKDVMDSLFKQRRNALQYLDIDANEIFIGQDDFMELTGQASGNPFSFMGEYWQSGKCFGCKVTVVPWMKGVLVVPSKRVA